MHHTWKSLCYRILRNSFSYTIGKAPASSSSLGLPCSWSMTLCAVPSAPSQVYTYRDLKNKLSFADKGMLYLWPTEPKLPVLWSNTVVCICGVILRSTNNEMQKCNPFFRRLDNYKWIKTVDVNPICQSIHSRTRSI